MSDGCSVSSGCLVVEAQVTQVAPRRPSVEVWMRNDWREQKRLQMVGLWRSDSQMKHLFAVVASWE